MKCVSKKCPFTDVNPDCCQFIDGCDFAVEQPTNGDRIRAMTDEELAKFIYTATRACNEYDCESCPIGDESCPTLNDWLKQPAEEK